MGTRGLRIVRFRGRYFVYWNQYDSYPEILGKMLVDQIPTDPQQYKVWLENERAIYAQMTAELEKKVLIVTEEKIIADLKRGAPSVTGSFQSGTYSAKSESLKSYQALDDRLEELPSVFGCQGIDLWVEWIYIVDLDREVFSVSSHIEQIHFRMDNIPRHEWITIFEEEQYEEERQEDGDNDVNDDENEKDNDNQNKDGISNEIENGNDNETDDEAENEKGADEGSFQICPYGTSEYPKHEYFGAADSSNQGHNKGSAKKSIIENDADNELREHRSKYRSYKCSTIQAKSGMDKLSKHANNQILTVVMFEKLMSPSFLHLKDYVHSWSHKDTAFRELAFAILSFAAGQYRFDELQRLEGQKSNGYLVDRTGDRTELLPVFGSGCHNPGVEPGSAPQESIYWFENVLVSLVPDTVIQDDVEAGIAKAVDFGLEAGSRDSYAVIFSLLNVVMLHVTVEDNVTTVKRTSIIEIATLEEGALETGDKLEVLCERRAGFISLIHFFNAAAERYVAPFGQGRFPTEIYRKILRYVDDDSTYKACAKVSRLFRTIYPGKIMFGKNLTVIKLGLGDQSQGEKWMFHFLDGNVEGVMEIGSVRETRPRPRGGRYWNPIVGTKRSSIITEVGICFITQKKKQVDEEGLGFSHRHMIWGPFNSNAHTVKVIWDLPEDVTARQVEELWAYYLQNFLHGGNEDGYFYTRPYTYACLLIPHYHEFSISCFVGNLWVCARRPEDGNTPIQRAETLAYVTSRFQNHSRGKSHSDLKDGEPVIVAFGVDMTLYYWREIGADKKGVLEPHLHFNDFSKEESRLEFETKVLTPLLSEWQEKLK